MLRSASLSARQAANDEPAPQAAPASDDPRPDVRLPPAGPPTAVIAGAAALAALATMLALNAHRLERARTPASRQPVGTIASMQLAGDDPAPPAGLSRLPSYAPAGPIVAGTGIRYPVLARSYPPAYAAPPVGRLGETGTPNFDPRQLDRLERGGYTPGARAQYVGGPGPGDRGGQSGDLAVLAPGDGGAGASAPGGGSGDDGVARASLIRNRGYMIAAGEIVHATLETAIDTAQPGLIRAIVAHDVYGFDGRNVLIPRGSRLIGEARANQQAGQHRVLALWSRLIRPDGAAIRIDSQAGDTLGADGIPGSSGSRFFARFANAVLQTAMTVGVNLANRGSTTVVLGGANPLGGVVGGVIPGADLPPTVKVKAGASISVFVARDLDFSRVPRP